MTGESELLAGESESGGELESGGKDCVRAGCCGGALGVKKPTRRTLGSMTAREILRGSMGQSLESKLSRHAWNGSERSKSFEGFTSSKEEEQPQNEMTEEEDNGAEQNNQISV